jgi:ABC-2 type transport system ATP-binding protein
MFLEKSMSDTHISDFAITIKGLTKLYNIPRQKAKRSAVSDLTLNVPAGEIFGFLGPNGAGKTTTIKILLNFITATSGSATIFGTDCRDEIARLEVGYMPEQPYFPKFLTTLEVVRAHGSLSNVGWRDSKTRSEAVLRDLGMFDHRHTPLSKLSKGMTQRVAVATALVGDPKILILDEPSSGLDPVGRKELRDLLLSLKSRGKTIFLSSHLLSEMEAICDRVAVLSGGRLVGEGRPVDIVQDSELAAVEMSGLSHMDLIWRQLAGTFGTEFEMIGANVRFTVNGEAVYPFISKLTDAGGKLVSVTPLRETLEDAFLRLVEQDIAA